MPPSSQNQVSSGDAKKLLHYARRVRNSGLVGGFMMLLLGVDRCVWESYGVGATAIVFSFLGFFLSIQTSKRARKNSEKDCPGKFNMLFSLTACLCNFGFMTSWIISLVDVATGNKSTDWVFFGSSRTWVLTWEWMVGILCGLIALNLIGGIAYTFAIIASFSLSELCAKIRAAEARRTAEEMAEISVGAHTSQQRLSPTQDRINPQMPLMPPPAGAHFYQPVLAPVPQAPGAVGPQQQQIIGYYVYPPKATVGDAPVYYPPGGMQAVAPPVPGPQYMAPPPQAATGIVGVSPTGPVYQQNQQPIGQAAAILSPPIVTSAPQQVPLTMIAPQMPPSPQLQ